MESIAQKMEELGISRKAIEEVLFAAKRMDEKG